MTIAARQLYTLQDTGTVLTHGEKKYVLKIRDLPSQDRPREKLVQHGPDVLSMQELVAIILTTGSRKEEVLSMSNRLLREYGEKAVADQKDPTKLQEELGIPLVKACQLVAAFELGRRMYKQDKSKGTVVRTPRQVFEYLHDMRDLPKEHLRGLYLNSRYQIIHDEVISIGSLNANIVHPREVFRPALEYGASAVILAHNHPSGVTKASDQDIEVTQQLLEAGKILGIHLLDHVVITKRAFASIPVEYTH